MRTTVTLDADVEQIVRGRMREQGVSFKEALNQVVRDGVRTSTGAFTTATARMGQPAVTLDRALQIAADFEDDELIRESRLGS